MAAGDADLILASASPRRRELLERVGFSLMVDAAEIDESALDAESPEACAARLAELKARAVAARHPAAWVVAADTIVAAGAELLGKPSDRDEAAAMLGRLLGRAHTVTTGFAIVRPGGGARTATVTTEVWMREIAAEQLESYLDSGEWRDKAGGYAIQGIAAGLVTAIRGSVTNVIGLPLAEVLESLAAEGGPIPDLGRGCSA